MSDATLAWHGRVTMTTANWDDQNGSTVTFALPTIENQRNPFHNYTKRRKGRAGTRFMAAIAHGEVAVYADEVMLAGWNDSQQNGHTVKFWLCNDNMGHPFEGYERKKDVFYLSLVELDDDNEPIDQKMRDRVEKQSTHASSRASYAAAMLCKQEAFWQFLNENKLVVGQIRVENELHAAQVLRGYLFISSRAELDKDKGIADKFHDGIRKPYLDWLESHC